MRNAFNRAQSVDLVEPATLRCQMLSEHAELTIGLVPQGGADWIAGVVYLENIARAVLAMNGNRPSLCFVAGPDHPLDRQNLTLDLPIYFYTHRVDDPWSLAAWNSVRSGHLPTSLEKLADRIGLNVLFPLQAPPRERLPVSWIGWIPDFQHKRRPEFFSIDEQAERDRRFRRIIDEATHVVVSSHDARADLMRWFPTTASRVSVLQFRTVLDPRWLDVGAQTVVERLGLPSKYLSYPSQFWLHKNHRTVFAALSFLRRRGRTDVVLVCTGREYDYRHPEYADRLKDEIARCGLEPQVRLLGLLDRRTQIQVMRKSAAVVQASVFEGWSALVEDARALGKRIFASDIPVHREQNPDNVAYFNPDSAEELADLIDREWAHLEPGPDLGLERRAREKQEQLTNDFARTFVDVVSRARRAA